MDHEDFKLDKVHKETLSREFTATEKAWYEENPGKEVSVKLSNVWIDDIPKIPPSITSASVQVIKDLNLTEDFTVEGHRTWFTCDEQGLLNTRLYDFIQPSKNHSIKYHVKVYDAAGKQVYIGEELEWDFDYDNGILVFKDDPSIKYAIPFKVSAYKYIGRKGSIDDLGTGGGTGESQPVTLDEAYNGVDGNGSGRIIEANAGPVRIKPSNGYAALQIDSVDYTPTRDVEDGQIIHRNGIAYIYDESRNTFLSMFRQAIAFGSKRADGVMMNISNFSSNMSGWPALRKGMIVGVTAQAAGGYSRKQIDIAIKDGDNLITFNLFDHAYANGSLDLPFDENDLIQIKVSSQYEVTYNLVLNLEIAWRL